MATILVSTQAQGFSFPNKSYMDRSFGTGRLLTVVRETGGNLAFWSSTDNGASWSDLNIDLTISNLQEWSGPFIDTDGFIHFAYRVYESGQDRIKYRRAGLNSNGTAFVWDTEQTVATATAASAGAIYNGLDFVVVKIGSKFYVHFAVGTTSGANIGLTLFSMVVEIKYGGFLGLFPYWAYTVNNGLIQGTRQWLAAGSGRVGPSIDFRHAGDAHTGSTPDLWVSWGRLNVYSTRLAYASGKWTGGAALTLTTLGTAQDGVAGRFDGQRFLVPVPNGNTVTVYERDISNTVTNVRISNSHPQGVIRYLAIDYTNVTGDFRIYAVGTTNANLYYADYVRGVTNTWTGWTLVTGPLSILNVNNFGTRRGAYGNAQYDYYYAISTGGNTYANGIHTIPFPPDTPVIDTPTTGEAGDINTALTIDWTFSDPDPNDSQKDYALSRQIGAGTVQYWRASDSTWQATEQKNTSGTTQVTLASGWGLDADAAHTYKVKVWDQTDVPSNYSVGVAVIPSAKVNPTIDEPDDSDTIVFNNVTVDWTVSEQTQFRIILTKSGVTKHDSGWVNDSASRSYNVPVVLDDLSTYVVTLQTKNNEGLASNIDSNTFNVDFVEPPIPTLDAAAVDNKGLMRVRIFNPIPQGLEPALANQDLYRRAVGTDGDGIRVGTALESGAVVEDSGVASGVNYEYQVTAFGVNGTSVKSSWVS